MSPAEKTADAIRHLCQDKDDRGRPIKGMLKHLVLSNTSKGWQAIAQFWFVDRWNISVGDDPNACIREVIGKAPDMRPHSKDTPDFISQREPEPADVVVAAPYEDDLLV